jgi:hypothetical protein
MLKQSVIAAVLTAAWSMPYAAHAADDKDLIQIREQIRQMKDEYEVRIRALEKRLQDAESKSEQSQPQSTSATVSAPATTVPVSAPTSSNGFNPAISLILGGAYANLSQDPQQYRLQGFLPSGDEVGPGKRSFNLGESELTLSANVDPHFAGQLTFSLAADNSVSVEEAFFRTTGLSSGLTLKGGRFLSSIGYLNSQHAHAWDFVDAPLAYQAFLGGQYKPDGLQAKWLAPTDVFLELGAEAGNGASYPGSDRNKNGPGATAIYVHAGDDIGESISWRTGLSYLRTGSAARAYDDLDHTGTAVTNAFTGSSAIWIADGILKWAPSGNSVSTNLKLQGEYFRRKENGAMTYDTQSQSLGAASGGYSSAQSGWYLQGIYQFSPLWRTGLRYDKLYSGTPTIGLLTSDFQRLNAYNPKRVSTMLDYSTSEFSRFRLQLARDQSRPGVTDNQIFLQYIMSLGAHGAHTF